VIWSIFRKSGRRFSEENATNLKIAFSGKVAAGFPKKMRPNL